MSTKVKKAAARLFRDREANVRLDAFPACLTPATMADGYRVQDELIKTYAGKGHEVGGWKVGLASTKMQDLVGIPHPIEGPILKPLIKQNGAEISANDFLTLCVEAEIGLVVGGDIEPRREPWNTKTIASRIGSAMVAIEIADDRDSNNAVYKGGGLNIANFVHNVGCVVGIPIQDWLRIDLSKESLNVFLNGRNIGCGIGKQIMGNPMNSAVWLINNLSKRGYNLPPGTVILTGCVTESIWLNKLDKFSVETENLGKVSVKVSD